MCLCVRQGTTFKGQDIFKYVLALTFCWALSCPLCARTQAQPAICSPQPQTHLMLVEWLAHLSHPLPDGHFYWQCHSGAWASSTTQKEYAPFNCSIKNSSPYGIPTVAKPPCQPSWGKGMGKVLTRTPQTPTVLIEFQQFFKYKLLSDCCMSYSWF